MEICSRNICTGCEACVNTCPLHCISMREDDLGVTYPIIDETICVSCGKCYDTCPNNQDLKGERPIKVYAAWSTNKDTRITSASGGIASELYRHFISISGSSYGVYLNSEQEAHFIPVNSYEDILKVRNSKYVYSEMGDVYHSIQKQLEDNKRVLFIGLPCQVAGVKSFLGKDYGNLTMVDIICHGVMPWIYLQQHVRNTIKVKDTELQVQFRDPKLKTSKFSFTIRKKGKLLYKTDNLSDDLYQHGYHRGVCYRENCYNCQYAKIERLGDITISDFSGLGRISPINYSLENVSCILVNTSKGEQLLRDLEGRIEIDERPFNEAYDYESMLQHPTPRPEIRDVFVNAYKKTRDYDQAAEQAMHDSIKEFVYRHYSWHTKWKKFKRMIKKFIKR